MRSLLNSTAYFPFPFLRRVDKINKYSCKKLIDFQMRGGACAIRRYCALSAPRRPPRHQTRRLFTMRLRMQQEADSEHARLHMPTGEISHQRGKLRTLELGSDSSDSPAPANHSCSAHSSPECAPFICAAPARRREERTTSFET